MRSATVFGVKAEAYNLLAAQIQSNVAREEAILLSHLPLLAESCSSIHSLPPPYSLLTSSSLPLPAREATG